MYEYGIKFLRVIDGDTFVCNIDLGFGIWLVDQHCRLHGLDTPEHDTPEGKACIEEAKLWFSKAIENKEQFSIQVEHKDDKYGRRLVQIRTDRSPCTLNEQLIKDGHAVPYSGGNKQQAWSNKKAPL